MRKETEIIENIVYITDDGERFNNIEHAKAHELQIKNKAAWESLPKIKISTGSLIGDGIPWFYAKTKEEFFAARDFIAGGYINNWFAYISIHQADFAGEDWYHFKPEINRTDWVAHSFTLEKLGKVKENFEKFLESFPVVKE